MCILALAGPHGLVSMMICQDLLWLGRIGSTTATETRIRSSIWRVQSHSPYLSPRTLLPSCGASLIRQHLLWLIHVLGSLCPPTTCRPLPSHVSGLIPFRFVDGIMKAWQRYSTRR